VLGSYSRHFPTVEINDTFYRMPTERVLENWAETVPAGFRFALKLNQKITHIQKLRHCESTLTRFLADASLLANDDWLGPVLVRLPQLSRRPQDVG